MECARAVGSVGKGHVAARFCHTVADICLVTGGEKRVAAVGRWRGPADEHAAYAGGIFLLVDERLYLRRHDGQQVDGLFAVGEDNCV